MAKITNDTSLLIQGVKSKLDEQGNIVDIETRRLLDEFIKKFILLVTE